MKGALRSYMTDITRKNNFPLDNFGRLTDPLPEDITKYDLHAIGKYAKENNKQISELTQEEKDKFIIK